MKKTCEICEKPSGMYPLCKDCFQLRDEGKIEKCPDCGKWHFTSEQCECQIDDTTTNEEGICIVCGEPTRKKYLQCKECYHETLEFIDSLDKNSDIAEFRDHYYNLKDAIFRMKKFENVKSNCNRLIAIAMQNKTSNNDTALTAKMETDVKKLIESKKPKPNIPVITPTEKDEERDEEKTKLYPTVDGHRVKSEMEQKIDDELWNLGILHSYEQQIAEFVYVRKKCDWFIPISRQDKGIYIEYWGMTTPKYLQQREEKEKLYKENNIPYISIEKDEPKDTRSLRNYLQQEIKRTAIEYFGFMPEWKK